MVLVHVCSDFEADLIQAQKILQEKDAQLEDEKRIREEQLSALKNEYLFTKISPISFIFYVFHVTDKV